MEKSGKTYPLTYDAIVGTGGPGHLDKSQSKSLNNHIARAISAAALTSETKLPAAAAALSQFGQEYPKGVKQDLSATPPMTIPETKRRWLGVLPPKIPFTSQLRAALRDTGDTPGQVTAGFIAHDDLDEAAKARALDLVREHYLKYQGPIGNNLLTTNLARRNSPEEYMARINQTPEEFMPRAQKKAAAISFEWAKSGSWEQYEQELDRVIKQAVIAPVMPPSNAMASTPVTPPPPTAQPGIMDRISSTAGGLHDSAISGMKSMGLPSWSHNPLIGAGIGAGVGALGGLLTDNRKGRGMLQGALLGGGLGALGGAAYDQFGQKTPAPEELAKVHLPAATKPEVMGPQQEPGLLDRVTDTATNMAGNLKTMGGHMWDAASSIGGTEIGSALPLGIGGKLLYDSGKHQAMPFEGANPSNTADRVGAPASNILMRELQQDPAGLQNIIQGVSNRGPVRNPVSGKVAPNQQLRDLDQAPRNNFINPEQQQANLLKLQRGGEYGMGQRLYDSTIGRVFPTTYNFQTGNEVTPVTRQNLLKEHIKNLETEARMPLKPVDSLNRGFGARKILGAGGIIGSGLLTADSLRRGIGALTGGVTDPVTGTIGSLQASPDTANLLLKAVQSSPDKVQQALSYMQNHGWSQVWQNKVLDTLKQQP